MLNVEAGKRMMRIYVDERLTLFHAHTQPFIAVDDGGDDLSNRLFQSHTLTHFSYDERRQTVRFYAGRRSVTFELSEDDGGLVLTPIAWSHKFSGCTLRLSTRVGEPIFGGGAQHPPNLKGRKIELWSEYQGSYGGCQDAALLKSMFAKEHTSDGTYPRLFFHDGTHRWFSIDFGGKVTTDFTAREYHQLSLSGLPQRIVMGVADSADDIALHAQRQRTVPPAWLYEGIMCGATGGSAELLRRLERFMAAGAPVSSVYIRDASGTDGAAVFRDLEVSGELYPRLHEMLDKLKARNVRAVAPVAPLCAPGSKLFAAAQRLRCLVADETGQEIITQLEGTAAAHIDLTADSAVELCADMIAQNILAIGFDGLQCEMTDCLPDGAVLSDGSPSEQKHNAWDDLWRDVCVKAFERAGKPPVILDPPSDGAGAAFVRGGVPGLRSALGEVLSMASSGFALSGIDLGAHFDAIPPSVRGEAVSRYAELAAFLPLFRLPSQPGRIFDDDTFGYVVRCARLHLALAPYVAALYDEYAQGGLPPVRHMVSQYPLLKGVARLAMQFMLGVLLVVPVMEHGTSEVEVVLPEGDWVRLLDGAVYSGDVSGRSVTVGALPESLAVFYRRDSTRAAFFEGLRL